MIYTQTDIRIRILIRPRACSVADTSLFKSSPSTKCAQEPWEANARVVPAGIPIIRQ